MSDPTSSPPAAARRQLWYKQAVIYQAHVRSYYDSDANGVGDFRGLTQKLDYLQDLGVTALWLLPFYPSPLRDEGYDIADYLDVNPIYGSLRDFKRFLREAHRRGLRVITELVINHTSDQHGWFQRARRAKAGSRWRNFYVWSDTPDKYREARIIFKDFEVSNWTYDHVAQAYYWHRFYAHQPDLNFDNPEVHREVLRALDFWLDLGVDGLRLDAVPYLYEREGTNCENLEETHQFLKMLRRHVDEKYGDRMLLAEANQWPEDSVTYFGQGTGDECHMAFHFPVMPRLFMAVRMEDRVPIVDILEQTPAIPETSQWAVFLRNHDELTLEMVTDEERDYMYRVYAQDTQARLNLGIRRRLAPLLGNDRKRIELLNALLMSLTGTPVIYYGDEIGLGDNIFLGDRNGVRTPMQWSSDKNAGFSRANPQSLYLPIILDPEYHYEAVNVEAQQRNRHSLLWWMKRLLALRKRSQALGNGTLEFLSPENRKILAFIRRAEPECVLVVANLSRFVQPVELDLARFQQMVPVELFGRTAFPTISGQPYFLTLGPHAFYWFALTPRVVDSVQLSAPAAPAPDLSLRTLEVEDDWGEVLERPTRVEFEACLPDYIRARRWFGGKTRELKTVRVAEALAVRLPTADARLLLLDVEYVQGDPQHYLLPLGYAEGAERDRLIRDHPNLVIGRLQRRHRNREGILFDGIGCRDFTTALLETILRRRSLRGNRGEASGFCLSAYRNLQAGGDISLDPVLGKADQSNSVILYGDQLFLKLFRRVETGAHPELELGRFLAQRRFEHAPALVGGLEYRGQDGKSIGVGILQRFIPGGQDGWGFTLDCLSRFHERVESLPEEASMPPPWQPGWVRAEDQAVRLGPKGPKDILGTYVEAARLLGDRTGRLHLTLASDLEDKDFAPEPLNPFYQRSLYQSMRNQTVENFALLRRRLPSLPEAVRGDAQRVLELQGKVLERFRAITQRRLSGSRIRVHGDYHLGQVLHTGKDFVIVDFEGEPVRAMSERRLKQTALRDVAGMLRSFDYAAHTALWHRLEQGLIRPEKLRPFEHWTEFWSHWIGMAFLDGYLGVAGQADFLPSNRPDVELLLEVNLLHRATYELAGELQNRPTWLRIPLQGILRLLGEVR